MKNHNIHGAGPQRDLGDVTVTVHGTAQLFRLGGAWLPLESPAVTKFYKIFRTSVFVIRIVNEILQRHAINGERVAQCDLPVCLTRSGL
jgi:hypothetical protein